MRRTTIIWRILLVMIRFLRKGRERKEEDEKNRHVRFKYLSNSENSKQN